VRSERSEGGPPSPRGRGAETTSFFCSCITLLFMYTLSDDAIVSSFASRNSPPSSSLPLSRTRNHPPSSPSRNDKGEKGVWWGSEVCAKCVVCPRPHTPEENPVCYALPNPSPKAIEITPPNLASRFGQFFFPSRSVRGLVATTKEKTGSGNARAGVEGVLPRGKQKREASLFSPSFGLTLGEGRHTHTHTHTHTQTACPKKKWGETGRGECSSSCWRFWPRAAAPQG